MEIKQVAIFGAGAVGAYFIWGLAPVLGERLWVVAEGERAERLRRDGLRINGERHELTLRAPETAAGADLLLIATKYEAFCRALPDIAALAGPQTIVMSLLNGVESEKMLAEKLGTDRILPAMMKISSERRADGVHFVPEDTPGLFYGGWHRGERNELTEAVATLFARTQLHTQYCEDIWQEIWYKFALNISRNQPQAVIGCGIGAYKDSEHVAFLSRALRREVIEIAAAQGIDIANPGRGSGQSSPAAKRARYSTLQDLDVGRHTEVDMFAGAVMRLGEKYGVPTPYNTFIFHCIKALEEKNDGKFDYEQGADRNEIAGKKVKPIDDNFLSRVVIRKATRDDYAAVSALEALEFEFHRQARPDYFKALEYSYTKAEFEELLSHPCPICWLATLNEAVVGLCFGKIEKTPDNSIYKSRLVAFVQDLITQPENRGKGIATALMAKTREQALHEGAASMELCVWNFNAEAVRLYEKMGMKIQYYRMEESLTKTEH